VRRIFVHNPLIDGSSSSTSSSNHRPWDPPSSSSSYANNPAVIEEAKERITELVQTLLSMTGLQVPAFAALVDDDDDDDEGGVQDDLRDDSNNKKDDATNYVCTTNNKKRSNNVTLSDTMMNTKSNTVGFQPDKVPVALLASSCRYLLIDDVKGNELLYDIIRYYEMQAVGYDTGMT
jgi:hypothetical protein